MGGVGDPFAAEWMPAQMRVRLMRLMRRRARILRLEIVGQRLARVQHEGSAVRLPQNAFVHQATDCTAARDAG